MASGKLGNADLAAATYTSINTVPLTKITTANIAIVNRNSNAVTVRIAIAMATTPVAAEFIEYDVLIPANGVLERSGLVIGENEKLIAYASTIGVSVRVFGFEEIA